MSVLLCDYVLKDLAKVPADKEYNTTLTPSDIIWYCAASNQSPGPSAKECGKK